MKKRLMFILLAVFFLVSAISLGLFFIGEELSFLGFILAILILVLIVSIGIMQDTRSYPYVYARLSADAKGVSVTNNGNARATNIHVTLVPLDIEFDISLLDPDAVHEFALPQMVSEVKALIAYENEQGGRYMTTNRLSALGRSDEDLFQPLIPIFDRR